MKEQQFSSNLIDLVLVINDKFFKLADLQQDSKNFGHFSYHLEPITSLKTLSFKKILLGYPYVKTFIPLVPTPSKKEYQNLHQFFLPNAIFKSQKRQYFQLFPIDSESSRLAYYQLSEQGKAFIKKIPFWCSWDFLVSFCLKKYFKEALNLEQNVVLFFNQEIIFIQKYFADLAYYPNTSNLASADFHQVSQSLFPFVADESYFFQNQIANPIKIKKADTSKKQISDSIFLEPLFSFKDILNFKPAVLKAEILKQNSFHYVNLIYLSLLLFIVFSLAMTGYSFYVLDNFKKELALERNIKQVSQKIDSQMQELAIKGEKILQEKILAEVITESNITPLNDLENLQKWLPSSAWLESWEQKKGEIYLNLLSTDANFSKKHSQSLQDSFVEKTVTIEQLKNEKNNNKPIFVFAIFIKDKIE